MKTNNKHITHFYNNVCNKCTQSKHITITLNLNSWCHIIQNIHHNTNNSFVKYLYTVIYKQLIKQL